MGLEVGVCVPPIPPLPPGDALAVKSAGVGVVLGVKLPVAALLSLPPALLGVSVREEKAESEGVGESPGESEVVKLPPPPLPTKGGLGVCMVETEGCSGEEEGVRGAEPGGDGVRMGECDAAPPVGLPPTVLGVGWEEGVDKGLVGVGKEVAVGPAPPAP